MATFEKRLISTALLLINGRITLLKLVLLLATLFAAIAPIKAQDIPQIPVQSEANFLRLPIGVNFVGVKFGEVPAVAIHSNGHVFVFSRSNPTGGGPAYGIHAAQLFEFSPTGDFIREHGRGLYSWSLTAGDKANEDQSLSL